jgi:hypothetical protein
MDMKRVRHGSLKRDLGHRLAPAHMADRIRRYERHVRRRDGVTDIAARLLDGGPPVVQRGLFAGMRYPTDRLADIDVPTAKLLGVYEQEIATVFEDAIERDTRTFVDVGCADGYFAVGMPFVAPRLTTHAFDIARSARALCASVAAINDVTARVKIKDKFSTASLDGLDMQGALMLCDIEGAESTLFDGRLVSRLRHTFVAIEVHEHVVPGLSERLCSAFTATHIHRTVRQAEHRLEEFADLPLTPTEITIALRENRPSSLHWLVFDPRG